MPELLQLDNAGILGEARRELRRACNPDYIAGREVRRLAMRPTKNSHIIAIGLGLAVVMFVAAVLWLAGCKTSTQVEADAATHAFIRAHWPCKIVAEMNVGHPYFDGTYVVTDGGWTQMECAGIEVNADYIEGNPWRP
jgi:hypothetical protein